MGIRIHKCLGYGLNDIKTKKGKIVDERFNLVDGYFASGDTEEDFKFEDFKTYLKNLDDKMRKEKKSSMIALDIMTLKESNKFYDFYNVIHYENEYGLKNVLLIQPFHKDWSRYDDMMDYIENPTKNRVKILDRALYPYLSFTNKQTKLNHMVVDDYNIDCIEIKRNMNYLIEQKASKKRKDELAKEYGFTSFKEMNETIVPSKPEILFEICKFTKMFKDINTVYDLKPMIYEWWS